MTEIFFLGIDIGGSKTLFFKKERGKAEHSLSCKEKENEIPTKKDDGLRSLIQEIEKYRPFAAIGIGIAGQVSQDKKTLLFAPNLAWENIPLAHMLSSHFGVPVTLMNDVQAAAMAEWRTNPELTTKTGFAFFWGTGIGGACMFEGDLWRGVSGTAGEIGHMIVRPGGRPCACGRQGCLEAYAGGSALSKLTRFPTTKEVIEAAQRGDPEAKIVWEEAQSAVVAALVSLVHTFNPEVIVFGGGVIEAFPSLIVELFLRVNSAVLPAARGSFQFIKNTSGRRAAALGAALYSESHF